MLNIAITGGIGSGKSTVTEYLRSRGFTVIDADAIAREMTAPGGKSLPLIRERFGDILFNEDGSLNRAAVRGMIFRDPVKKEAYEDCTTRLVLEEIEAVKAERAKSGERVIFCDIPLLYETHAEGEYDYVWLITADQEIRKKRVMERDHIDTGIISLIMDSQSGDDEKAAKADIVISNNGTVADLRKAVDDALKNF